ncbi:MAG: hypothetical protein M3Q56_09770 [Bacteroidota bacterium]|nr:hypothetical protein [Bacteroidota bacterium]
MMKPKFYLLKFSLFLVIFGCMLILILIGSCAKEHKETIPSISGSSANESKFQNYLKSRKSNSFKQREDETYTVDESVYVLESILNYDYAFGTNRSSHLVRFQDTLYVQTDNQTNPLVSQADLDQVYEEVTSALTDHYQEIEGSNDTIVTVTITRIDNVNGQGQFPVVCSSLFSTSTANYLEDEVEVDCLEFMAPFPEGDNLKYGRKLGYCDNRMAPETDAAIELTKEINQTFDPNPRVYYNDIRKTCAADNGFHGKCEKFTVFDHAVSKQGETLDNILDAKVFARYGNRPNYDFCIAYNHLNCYFGYMMSDISQQYTEDSRVFFCINIISDLIPSGDGAIGLLIQDPSQLIKMWRIRKIHLILAYH